MVNEIVKIVKVCLVCGLCGIQLCYCLLVCVLGLNKFNDVCELKDSLQVCGLINKVQYFVQVEE